jgi:hypothetical protein
MGFEFIKCEVPNVFSYLVPLIVDGGEKSYKLKAVITPSTSADGGSGFDYKSEEIQAKVQVGFLFGDSGLFLHRCYKDSQENWERYDYFDRKGNFTFSSSEKSLEALVLCTQEMDRVSPILNQFYNFLSVEYKKASSAQGHSSVQIHEVERFLRRIYRSQKKIIPLSLGLKDPAIKHIYDKILKLEMDPVLSWEERQLVFKNYQQELEQIIRVKVRAHGLGLLGFKLKVIARNISCFWERINLRPASNLKGLLYRYSIGKVIWFFQTVKNNLGYSVALAVYGPFTYYFITMPMNPHAMQAVGKVRAAYLEVKSEISEIYEKWNPQKIPLDISGIKPKVLTQNTVPMSTTSDEVTTQAAAPASSLPVVNSSALANIIYESPITSEKNQEHHLKLADGEAVKYRANFLNMLLTTDVEKVDGQGWNERMSNFKQMQIAYEENIEYASRMGRLEQLETQYNFPMQIEASWEELERYNNLIFKFRDQHPNLSAKMKQYLFNEINRTQQLQLYLWDRMGRFILDQIYVMLDQDNEQKRNDYYVGRSFVFMQEMTNILSWRYKNFKRHQGHERIEKLADFYSKNRKEFGSVVKNLQANSKIFQQKDVLDTTEFRTHMKRQWEILFLQNSKAEEASNNGLNMYIWSVRNTAWVLQSLFSAKREELEILIRRDTSGQMLSAQDQLARGKIAHLYETLVHNLTLEYVGIKEELSRRLNKDIEFHQRQIVLENLKEFLSDREKLDGMNPATTATATTTATAPTTPLQTEQQL